jgi:uncharacterized protein YggU (UPF0235/DUF167 family)
MGPPSQRFYVKNTMKIFVKAKPAAREEPPVHGRANAAISKALANYFKVSSSQVRLISGFSSKQKVFEIEI